jgi:hypothetical protein
LTGPATSNGKMQKWTKERKQFKQDDQHPKMDAPDVFLAAEKGTEMFT